MARAEKMEKERDVVSSSITDPDIRDQVARGYDDRIRRIYDELPKL
jgi:hypothetical protein